ncbi:aspartate phosphatase [Bacillus stercoris]|uniref:response regulator aspartate phosphatase n=1 Tax=Bacillus stercoris TaxID=2054641 RepID=UPI003CF5CE65
MSRVASEVVASLLNEFHLAIKKNEADKAKELFEKCKLSFNTMEEDQNVLVYFSLLEERYRMMRFDTRGEKIPSDSRFNGDKLRDIQRTDEMIDYYFFFYEAMYESYNKNYEQSIRLFKIAEKKLLKIPDEIEIAEFYSKVASMYMSIHQSVVSLGYINEAISIYRKHDDYKRRLASSLVVLATNYMHIGRYDDAEKQIFEAIKIARELNDGFFEAMQFHNMSIIYSNANRSQDCLNALKRAIRNDAWRESDYHIRSIYMLAREHFKIGQKDTAIYYSKKGMEVLKERENKIYEAKINIIYSLYTARDTSKSVDKCRNNIRYLENRNDLDGAYELSLIISKYYEKERDFKEALEFANKAIEIETRMKNLEGE